MCAFFVHLKKIWMNVVVMYACIAILQDGSFGSFPSELAQMLLGSEDKDDATSPLTKPVPLKNEIHTNNISDGNFQFFQEVSFFWSIVLLGCMLLE